MRDNEQRAVLEQLQKQAEKSALLMYHVRCMVQEHIDDNNLDVSEEYQELVVQRVFEDTLRATE